MFEKYKLWIEANAYVHDARVCVLRMIETGNCNDSIIKYSCFFWHNENSTQTGQMIYARRSVKKMKMAMKLKWFSSTSFRFIPYSALEHLIFPFVRGIFRFLQQNWNEWKCGKVIIIIFIIHVWADICCCCCFVHNVSGAHRKVKNSTTKWIK